MEKWVLLLNFFLSSSFFYRGVAGGSASVEKRNLLFLLSWLGVMWVVWLGVMLLELARLDVEMFFEESTSLRYCLVVAE